MALCDHCMIYDKAYDSMCAKYDDILPENTHHCRAYDTQIPNEIYFQNGDCEYHIEPEETGNGNR